MLKTLLSYRVTVTNFRLRYRTKGWNKQIRNFRSTKFKSKLANTIGDYRPTTSELKLATEKCAHTLS